MATFDTIQQMVFASSTSTDSTATAIPNDYTVPQSSEGKEYLTASITPTNATNILIVDVFIPEVYGSTDRVSLALFRDSSANAIAGSIYASNYVTSGQSYVRYCVPAGTTSSTTFKLRFGPSSGTAYIMSHGGTAKFGGALKAVMIITEYRSPK